MKMFEKVKEFFRKTWVNGAATTRKDEFVWMVAEALKAKDNDHDDDSDGHYYDEALYVIRRVQKSIAEATEAETLRVGRMAPGRTARRSSRTSRR